MKKALKLVGLSFLLIGTVAFTSSHVYAETLGSSESTVQEVETPEEAEPVVSTESTEEAENTLETSEAKAVVEKLKLWDVSYDKTNMEIVGKTEPYAEIAAESVDQPELAAGQFKADGNGTFVILNPPAGTNRITARLGDRVSEPIDVVVAKLSGEVSLAIKEVIFDGKTNTLTGKTAPNASVGMYVPSSKGEGTVQADKDGVFTIVDQFSPGMVMILTARDSKGNTGEPYSFRAPEVEVSDFLNIQQVSYDHKTQTLYGKTAPNAKISIDPLEGFGSYAVDSDAAGNFSLAAAFASGKKIVLRATDSKGNWGAEYSFTIPAASETQTSETSDTKQEEQAKPEGSKKGGLPSTGTTQNILLSVLGILVLLGVIMGYRKNRTVPKN